MNPQVLRLMRGYLALGAIEQRQFIEQLNAYIQGDQPRRKQIQEGIIERADLGPVGQICGCCGR